MNELNLKKDIRTFIILDYLLKSKQKNISSYAVYLHIAEVNKLIGKNATPGSFYNFLRSMITNRLIDYNPCEGIEYYIEDKRCINISERGRVFFDENINKFLEKSTEHPRKHIPECLILISESSERKEKFISSIKLNILKEKDKNVEIQEESTPGRKKKDTVTTESVKIIKKLWQPIELELSWKMATIIERQL
ncbi:MAG: hypothetical protein OEZ22_13850 [Spirochaetia bacterium]|nr:hypothetical protein [Spirochaetia bacterium]